MQTAEVRAKLFNVRFSDEEWARLEALCNHYGLNAAGLIRMLLKKEEREVFAAREAAPPPSSPRVAPKPPKKGSLPK